jgi:hypothetical protein
MASDFDHKRTSDVEVLNGWFLMVRRDVLDLVGPLDERFFMYGEDIDWCYRFNRVGERTVFLAEARAVHYGGASSNNAPLRFQVEMFRANGQFWKKHHGRSAQIVYYCIMLVHQTIRLLGYLGLLIASNRRNEAELNMKKAWFCLIWMISNSLPCAAAPSLATNMLSL